MALAAPSLDQLFHGLPADEQVKRFEAYKSALSTVHASTLNASRRGEISFDPTRGIQKTASTASRIDELKTEITKSISGDQLAAVQSSLDGLADLTKAGSEWTLTNPLNSSVSGVSGLVPYDLDPVLSLLIPKELFLRNSTARIKAQGQALEFRRITGLSNAGVGGVANLSSFFNSNTASTSFGGVALNRPALIQYAADKIVKSFVEQGLSDSVSLQAEYASQGYTDLRQLSHTSLLWSHFLAEERNLLNAVSTALPTSALTSVTAANDSTGSGLPATSSSAVYITLSSAYGETAGVSAGTVTNATAGKGVSVTWTGTAPYGAVAVNVYVVVGSTTYKATTPSLASGVTGLSFAAISGTYPSTDGSYNAYAAGSNSGTGYDGFISTFAQSGGYQAQFNNTVGSQSEPAGFIQDALVSLYNSTMADPEVIFTSAAVRRALSKALQTQQSSTSYRFNYATGSDGVSIGAMVTGVANEATGTMLDLVTHRFMPTGTMVIHQKQLPFPDSGVSQTVEVHNVVDALLLEWPQIGFTYDLSSYTYGTVAFRAPAWSGLITGITG